MTNIYVRKGNCALNLVVSVIAFAATIALVLDPDAHSYPHSIAISIVFAVNCLMFFTIFTYRRILLGSRF
jgi:hypothetical protein